jgi:hypothetical protein
MNRAPMDKFTARSSDLWAIFRRSGDIQHNHALRPARELTLMQPTEQKYEDSVLVFLLEFKCQNGIVYHHLGPKFFWGFGYN